MEKMPIHDTDTGSEVPAAGPTTQTSPGQALKTGLSQTGIGTAVQVGGALFIVVGLIFIARAMAKKWVPGVGASNGKNVIEILARYPLAKAQSLVMVRIGSQIVVLNQTKEASTSVLVISDQTEVAGILGQIQGGKPSSIQAGFTKLLANAQMDLERQDMSEPDAIEARMQANHVMEEEQLDEQLDEMAAAKRQLMELRTQVRTIRENLK
jgi:flagellar biogenesis protein FliO